VHVVGQVDQQIVASVRQSLRTTSSTSTTSG
jgi:hypothetical protein